MKKYLLLFFFFVSCASVNHQIYTIRLKPNDDVKKSLQNFAKEKKLKAASIISAVGSLTHYNLRFANQKEGTQKSELVEIVSLSGTLTSEAMHIHMAVSDQEGKTLGGHLLDENFVYTTLEITIVEDLNVEFKRVTDPTYGYQELKVIPRN